MNKVEANNTIKNFKTSVVGGAAATLSYAIFLPPEAKAAVQNTMFGPEHFKNTLKKATEENIKSTGRKLDLNLVMQNANRIYPDLVKTSKLVAKSLKRTFISVTAGLFLAKSCISLSQNIKSNKLDK